MRHDGSHAGCFAVAGLGRGMGGCPAGLRGIWGLAEELPDFVYSNGAGRLRSLLAGLPYFHCESGTP